MKYTLTLLLAAGLLSLGGCRKNTCAPEQNNTAFTQKAAAFAKGGGGGGTTTTTGPIQNFLTGTAGRLISGTSDSMFISFTQPVPAGGYTITLSSANPAVAQVPATITAPQGAWNVAVPVTGGSVAATQSVTITASLNGQTKTSTIKVYPLNFSFAAPALQSPSNGSSQNYHIMIIFQWAANANAYYSELQISATPTFSPLIYDFYTDMNQYPADYFNGTGIRYWRVRYVDGAGNGGPWSATRTFTVKPQ